MQIGTFFLALHLLGAGFSFVIIIKSLFLLVSKDIPSIRKASTQLWSGTFFQVATGIGLLFATPHLSYISFCTKLGLYVGIIFLIQGIFYLVSKEKSIFLLKSR